ncbi:YhaN family protein [Ruegeria sp. HKCCD7559]|uniref:YhaN family protein n=1 Tax=Ruegeria TaxID=97050 RepID=UPI001490B24E|nr:YhaN family protein [Ruegeria sp. HKCCD7559]NOC47323.1 AAA family ATPase [Ruegeria sp. HKCCD7559]
MRIQRLALDVFGHFSGKVLDFGAAGRTSDFHLIYGPNEAGKTTTMEAYLRLLYGFPNRDTYGFKHQRANLKVSGLLEIDGDARLFTRLPSRNSNLRGDADAILPETAIAAHLGGLSADDYRSLLCLDDDTIEKGGEEIANARGDIGKLLFSAAAGVADLNTVLDQARVEANALYKKRSSSTRVAELKRELSEIDRDIRDLDVSAAAWRKLKDGLAAAQAAEENARQVRDDLRVEQSQTDALRRVIPRLAQLDRLVAEIADKAHYPDRIDIDPEMLVKLLADRGQAETDLERLTGNLNEAEKELENLPPDESRLNLSQKLDDLDELRSRTLTAAMDIPRRQRRLDEVEADMKRVVAELGAPEDADVGDFVVSAAEITALEELRGNMRDAVTTRNSSARELGECALRVAQAEKTLREVQEAAPLQSGAHELLVRFDADRLAPAFATASQAMLSAEASARDALNALTVGDCTFSALPACPVDRSTAEDLADQHGSLTEKIARLDERLEDYEESIAIKAAQISALAEGSAVVGDAEAQEAQAQRDALWQAHCTDLTAQSAALFEPAMTRVDDINASRLVHAAELGALRKMTQDQAETEARKERVLLAREGWAAQAKEFEDRIIDYADKIGLPELSPRAIANWVDLHVAALAAHRRRNEVAEQHKDTIERAERLRQQLAPLLPLEDPTFDAALASARDMADSERAYKDVLRETSEKLTELQGELERRQSGQDDLGSALERAGEIWRSKVGDLFGTRVSPDRLAASPGVLGHLREWDATRQSAARQVFAMQEDQRQFEAAVAELSTQFAIGESTSLDAFARLRQIAEKAQDDQRRYTELIGKKAEHTELRENCRNKLADIDRTVTTLGAVFPDTVDVSTLEALRNAVGTAKDVIRVRAQVAEIEEQILSDLSKETLDEARIAAGEHTLPVLEARAQSLAGDLKRVEDTLSETTVARANAEKDLGAISGSAEIAELVERRAILHLQIEDAILNYVERDLGLRVAEEAIRRYRDRHRSEMMAATERAFAELTNGAYQKLLTQPEGASEILLAVDGNGTSKQVGDMSKGTRFQLYLALRAAAYEQMVSQGVQLPFFCDDIFETFDEDRTRAACRLMERIGQNGQAIYLTHHRHVVEIAKEVCENPPVIHNLMD